jgi:hypothetical protein
MYDNVYETSQSHSSDEFQDCSNHLPSNNQEENKEEPQEDEGTIFLSAGSLEFD